MRGSKRANQMSLFRKGKAATGSRMAKPMPASTMAQAPVAPAHSTT
jgi:hypothetical protein